PYGPRRRTRAYRISADPAELRRIAEVRGRGPPRLPSRLIPTCPKCAPWSHQRRTRDERGMPARGSTSAHTPCPARTAAGPSSASREAAPVYSRGRQPPERDNQADTSACHHLGPSALPHGQPDPQEP